MLFAKKSWWLLVLFLCCGIAVPNGVDATSARKHALNNSPFFFDDTDVFLYPGVLVHHSNKLIVEGQSSPLSGSASAIYGDRFVMGVFGNRSAIFNDLAATTSLYGLPQKLTLPRRIFDLMAAIRIGDNQSIGLGFSFATMLSSESNLSGSSRGNRTTGAQTSSFELMLGYSLRQNKLALDVGVELTFNNYKITEADIVEAEGAAVPSFSLRGRAFYQLNPTFDLAVDLVVARRHYAISTPSNLSSAAYGYFMVEALIGPRIAISMPRIFSITEGRDGLSKTQTKDNGNKDADADADTDKPIHAKEPTPPLVKAYFTGGLLLGYQSLSGSNNLRPDGLNQSELERSTGELLFPGFHASVEAVIWEYLVVRFGFTARFYFANSSSKLPGFPDPVNSEEPSNRTPATQSNTQQVYSWAAGIGLNLGGLRIDGSFEAPLFTDGPNFIGGRQPGLFALISLSYAWR